MSSIYIAPDNPADPEAAALELIVRVPTDLLGYDSPPRDALQDFTSLPLHGRGGGCVLGGRIHTICLVMVTQPTGSSAGACAIAPPLRFQTATSGPVG